MHLNRVWPPVVRDAMNQAVRKDVGVGARTRQHHFSRRVDRYCRNSVLGVSKNHHRRVKRYVVNEQGRKLKKVPMRGGRIASAEGLHGNLDQRDSVGSSACVGARFLRHRLVLQDRDVAREGGYFAKHEPVIVVIEDAK